MVWAQTEHNLSKKMLYPLLMAECTFFIVWSRSGVLKKNVKWENNLSLVPTPDSWPNVCKTIISITSKTNLQFIQYETICRNHFTQCKLFKMGITTTYICPYCTSGSIVTYLNATWFCQPFFFFWTSVIKTLLFWTATSHSFLLFVSWDTLPQSPLHQKRKIIQCLSKLEI